MCVWRSPPVHHLGFHDEDVSLHTCMSNSVASPICQEGQSERTFPILVFYSRFFFFFSIFSWFFLSFPRFFLFSPIFDNFSLSRGALCTLAPYTGYATVCISEYSGVIFLGSVTIFWYLSFLIDLIKLPIWRKITPHKPPKMVGKYLIVYSLK